jgi:transcriptional regulatory protein RtcR
MLSSESSMTSSKWRFVRAHRCSSSARRAPVNRSSRPGNFRELAASITRMATPADGGRITEQLVEAEIAPLRDSWLEPVNGAPRGLLPESEAQKLDAFDHLQLESVIDICRRSRSLADAGRSFIGASRSRRSTINDSDSRRKYLARFSLEWATLVGREV